MQLANGDECDRPQGKNVTGTAQVLLFPTWAFPDRDEFDNMSELIYYKPCTLSTK